MALREYKTVPLPMLHTRRRRGRNPAEGAAEAIQNAINEMAARGWTYLRAETIRAMESQGLLKGREEVAYTVLIFDRPARAQPVDDDHDAEPEPMGHADAFDDDGFEEPTTNRGLRAPFRRRPAPAPLEERDRAPAPERRLDLTGERAGPALRGERRREPFAEPEPPRRRPETPSEPGAGESLLRRRLQGGGETDSFRDESYRERPVETARERLSARRGEGGYPPPGARPDRGRR